MKHALIFSALLSAFGCGHVTANSAERPTMGQGVEFLFLPSDPKLGLMGIIPISTRGICAEKGVFADAFLGVLVDALEADDRALAPEKRDGVYDGSPAGSIVIRPDTGFTYQVSQRDLEANFFEWSEMKQPVGFIPPSHGQVHGTSFELKADKDGPLDVVIRYRIRCADLTLSEPLSTRGQNLSNLAWRSVGRPTHPLRRTASENHAE
jgi:hypothetical protein